MRWPHLFTPAGVYLAPPIQAGSTPVRPPEGRERTADTGCGLLSPTLGSGPAGPGGDPLAPPSGTPQVGLI